MCRGTIFICLQCGTRRIRYSERCSEADDAHRLTGRRYLISACPLCRLYEQNRLIMEGVQLQAEQERAKALLEHLNGFRASPLIDSELNRTRARNVAPAIEYSLRMALHPFAVHYGSDFLSVLETLPEIINGFEQKLLTTVIRFWQECFWREHLRRLRPWYDDISTHDMVYYFHIARLFRDPPPPPFVPVAIPQPSQHELLQAAENNPVPLNFVEWILMGPAHPARPVGIEDAFIWDTQHFIEYLAPYSVHQAEFVEYLTRIIAIEEDSWAFHLGYPEFGFLPSFRDFIEPWVEAIPWRQLLHAYCTFLVRRGHPDALEQWRDARFHVLNEHCRELEAITFNQEEAPPLLSFAEWEHGNAAENDDQITAEASLYQNVEIYLHDYLGQRAETTAASLEFRQLRDRIFNTRNSEFYFGDNVEALSWSHWRSLRTESWRSDPANFAGDVVRYSNYLNNSGHPELDRQFQEVRAAQVLADSMEFRGLPRGQAEESDLGWVFDGIDMNFFAPIQPSPASGVNVLPVAIESNRRRRRSSSGSSSEGRRVRFRTASSSDSDLAEDLTSPAAVAAQREAADRESDDRIAAISVAMHYDPPSPTNPLYRAYRDMEGHHFLARQRENSLLLRRGQFQRILIRAQTPEAQVLDRVIGQQDSIDPIDMFDYEPPSPDAVDTQSELDETEQAAMEELFTAWMFDREGTREWLLQLSQEIVARRMELFEEGRTEQELEDLEMEDVSDLV